MIAYTQDLYTLIILDHCRIAKTFLHRIIHMCFNVALCWIELSQDRTVSIRTDLNLIWKGFRNLFIGWKLILSCVTKRRGTLHIWIFLPISPLTKRESFQPLVSLITCSCTTKYLSSWSLCSISSYYVTSDYHHHKGRGQRWYRRMSTLHPRQFRYRCNCGAWLSMIVHIYSLDQSVLWNVLSGPKLHGVGSKPNVDCYTCCSLKIKNYRQY